MNIELVDKQYTETSRLSRDDLLEYLLKTLSGLSPNRFALVMKTLQQAAETTNETTNN